MIIECLTVGPLMTNCYLFACEATSRAAIIDPGGDAERIIERVSELSLQPDWIIDTHGHGDHIGAQQAVKAQFPEAQIAVHEIDAPLLTSPVCNLSAIIGIPITSPPADRILQDGDEIAVGNLSL